MIPAPPGISRRIGNPGPVLAHDQPEGQRVPRRLPEIRTCRIEEDDRLVPLVELGFELDVLIAPDGLERDKGVEQLARVGRFNPRVRWRAWEPHSSGLG